MQMMLAGRGIAGVGAAGLLMVGKKAFSPYTFDFFTGV